jgi:hypothetical protein
MTTIRSNATTVVVAGATGIDRAADWQARSAGAMFAENWARYADAAAAYNAVCYAANKNPSQGTTFANAYEIVTTPGHVLSGKALRLWHGKNNYGSSGVIDNQWWIMLFNGSRTAPAAAYRTKVYVQVCVWTDDIFDYYWLRPGGTVPNGKLFIVDFEGGSATVGEVVIDNRGNRGFPTCYRITDGGSFSYIERATATPANRANFSWQNAIDRGAPVTVVTQNDWERRYGPCYSGMTGGTSQAMRLSAQGVPDPDAAIGGVPWNRGGITVIEVEIDLPNDRVRYWASAYGKPPVLCGDTRLDNNNGGRARLGSRVKPNGVGWNAIHLSNLNYLADGASNPGYPLAYTDYAEIIVSEIPIRFPGGYAIG